MSVELNQIVWELTVDARAAVEGANKGAYALEKVATSADEASDAVAAFREEQKKLEQSNTATSKALDRNRAALDNNVKGYQQIIRQSSLYDKAIKQGADLNEEKIRVLSQMQRNLETTGNVYQQQSQRITGFLGLNKTGLVQLQAVGVNTFQSLAAGISPMSIAMNQGAQAMGALVQGGAVSGATLAGIGTIAAAAATGVLAVGAAFVTGVAEAKEFERVTTLTGNAAGVTAGSIESIAEAAHNASTLSTGAAREIAVGFAETGKIGVEVIGNLTEMVDDFARATGQSTDEAAKSLAKMFSDPADGMKSLDDAYNLLSVSERQHIRNLIDQGDRTAAQIALSDSLNDRFRNMSEDGLTMLGRALKEGKNLWDGFWNAATQVGREESIDERLNRARKNLAEEQNTSGGMVGSAFSNPATIANLKKIIAELENLKAVQDGLAASDASEARFREETKTLDDLTRSYDSYGAKQLELQNQQIRFAKSIDDVSDRINAIAESGGASGQPLTDMLSLFQRLKLGADEVAAAIAAMRTPLETSAASTKILRDAAGLTPAQRGPSTAYATELDRAQHGTRLEQENAIALAIQARERATISLNTAISDQNRLSAINAEQSGLVAAAYLESAAAGLKAEAARTAAQQAFATGVDAEARARQLLSESVDKTIESGAKSIAGLETEAAARRSLADATMLGYDAARQAEEQAKIAAATLAERTALANADAEQQSELVEIIDRKTQAIRDEAAAARDLATAQSIRSQESELDVARKSLELMGTKREYREVEMAHLRALIDLHKKEGDVLTENERKYVENAENIARINIQVQEQQAVYDEIGNFLTQTFDRVGSAITEAFTKGEISALKFGDVARGVASEVLQWFVKLSVINPLKNALSGASGNLPTLGSVLNLASGSAGSGATGGFNNPLSSLSNIFSSPSNLAHQFATSSLGTSLGLSTAGSSIPAVSAGGAIGEMAGGVTGGLTSAGSSLISIAGPIAAAVAAAFLAYQLGIIGPGPTSGPVGIADFSPGLGVEYQYGANSINPMEFLTADNGGNAEGMRPIAEAVADLISDNAERLGATINTTLRYRIANYANPEEGNSHDRIAGFEVNAFINGEAERRVAEGLSQEQAILEAFRFAVTEAFTFDSATLTEIARTTTADTTEGLLADLEFGRNFDLLRDAINDLGGEVNSNTVAQAANTIAIQQAAETYAETAFESIVGSLTSAIELFPAVAGTAIADAVNGGPSGNTGSSATSADATAVAIETSIWAVLESDNGAIRSTLPGYNFTPNSDDLPGLRNVAGTLTTPNGDFTVNHVNGDEYGPNFEVVDAAGNVVESFNSLAEALANADDVAQSYNDTLSAQTATLVRTAEEQARYDANRERVDFAIGLARVQVGTLVDTITGAFEPVTQGPFAEALETGRARLEALRPHLEDVNAQIADANAAFPELNAAIININETIEQGNTALFANLRDDLNESFTSRIREASGQEYLNTLGDLLNERSDNANEASTFGLDVNATAGALFNAQVGSVLQNLDATGLDAVLAEFTDPQLVAAVQQFQNALTGAATSLTATEFTDSITNQLRTANGQSYLNTLDELLASRSTNAAEAARFNLDVNATAGTLFNAQVGQVLQNLDADGLNAVLAEFTDPQLVAAVHQFQNALVGASDTISTSGFLGDLTERQNTASGLGVINQISTLIGQRTSDIETATNTGLNNFDQIGRLFNDEMYALLANSDLATLGRLLSSNQITDEQTRGVIELRLQEEALAEARAQAAQDVETLRSEYERAAAAARTLRQAAQGLLTNSSLSPLSPFEQLREARTQLEDAFALANDSTPDDEASQDALQRLPSLSQTMLELSKSYFGSTEGYLSDFNRAQDILNLTASRQESIEQQMLSQLESIEAAIIANGGTGSDAASSAAAAGYNFGTNVGANRDIYNALLAAGLPTPSAFGGGQLTALRQSNPAVHALLNAMGYANGGAFMGGAKVQMFANGGVIGSPTAFGMGDGGLGILAEYAPEAIMPLERRDGRLGVRVSFGSDIGDLLTAANSNRFEHITSAAFTPAAFNDNSDVVRELRSMNQKFDTVVQQNRALIYENAQQRDELRKSRATNERLSRELAEREASQTRRAYG